jgi:hypothetical protein
MMEILIWRGVTPGVSTPITGRVSVNVEIVLILLILLTLGFCKRKMSVSEIHHWWNAHTHSVFVEYDSTRVTPSKYSCDLTNKISKLR